MTRTAELASFNKALGDLLTDAPELEQFTGFLDAAEGDDALDHKTKELVSLAISVVVHCENCILWHTDAALKAGATHEEVVDALKVAVVMGGGPALTYAAEAHETLEALEDERGE
ncbi:carboxymuconolactone decarboxylase family protein [Haloarcula sp. JP-L23]|uniref:carboxymuconolactone decarboxylase family protein n=1 Tax=Haloarcula sp. JP-L23 TaxID=2716717 RepID=UPI00140EB432|nr:carboxymuconolactone decarboxylase family protein [Haloarcula sp. JP-L23]